MKVHLRTLGCRLNQGEIEAMARQFIAQGHEIVDEPAQADQIVVNTCAVTADASHSSRKLVRGLHRASPDAEITVTGCYAQIAPSETAVLGGVRRVVSNESKDMLVTQITGQAAEPYDLEPVQRGAPAWMGRTRAFIKVQDGCDNACTFCITTVARGAGRSRQIADVVAEVRMLHAMGYQEAVLTGVHLGSYGHDLGNPDGLDALVRALLADTDMPRIRLSSLEPWDIAPAFFSLWDDARVCPHLHLPLQSGSDSVLKRMLRRTSQSQFAALVAAARERIGDPCITTDVIVGFPGETDEEFETSLEFIGRMNFAGMHIFRYSRRPGTAAARMRVHVGEDVKKARSARLHALAAAQESTYARPYQGTIGHVLWEQVGGASEAGFLNAGYTENYLRVTAVHPRPLTGLITPALLAGWDENTRCMTAVPHIDGAPERT
jgi:threonylcarbamoyladenosine tRNA methylthiotransferase MtaB